MVDVKLEVVVACSTDTVLNDIRGALQQFGTAGLGLLEGKGSQLRLRDRWGSVVALHLRVA